MASQINVDPEVIKAFCTRWQINAFAFFGSVLREDFGPDSDIDVLVTLSPSAEWDLFDWIDMHRELEAILGRRVDLVEKTTLRNPYRREAILAESEPIYAVEQVSEDDGFDYRLEHDAKFLRKIARARGEICKGQFVSLDDLPDR